MAKPSANGEERSGPEQQLPNNRRSRPSVLPDLNLLFSPSEVPANRPEEEPLISTNLPVSETSSEDEIEEDYGDDGDYDDEDEEIINQLAQIFITRELAILMNWMEELRQEILKIREELRILQKKLGVDVVEDEVEEDWKSTIMSCYVCLKSWIKQGRMSFLSVCYCLKFLYTECFDFDMAMRMRAQSPPIPPDRLRC